MLPIPDLIQMRLVLVLGHFLWQGALIAALLAGIVAIARVRPPRMRYAASILSLAMMAACPVITWYWLPVIELPDTAAVEAVVHAGDAPTVVPSLRRRDAASDNAIIPSIKLADDGPGLPTLPESSSEFALNPILPPAPTASEIPAPSSTLATDAGSTAVHQPPAWWQPAAPWIVAGWLIGVAILSLRLLIGTVGTWRWRRQLEPLPQSLVTVVGQLCGLLGMRVPRVALSSRVTEAVAIGLFRPLVLLPTSWATSIPADMLAGILAHELAHIRRYDLWVNLFQRVVETLFFYHPAVWWLSNRLRTERELCCDDLAVSVTRDRVRYAEMLEHVGRMRLSKRLSPVAVSIANPKRALLERVRHVLRAGATDDVRGSSVVAAMLLALVVVCGALITSRDMLSAGEWSWKKMTVSGIGDDRHHAFLLHNGTHPTFVVVRLDPAGTESSSNGLQTTRSKRGGSLTHKNFTISFEATHNNQPLETLTINGQSFLLDKGRVLVMGDKYEVTQLPVHEPAMVTETNLKAFVDSAVAQAKKPSKRDNLLDKRVEINLKDAPLPDVLAEIAKQASFKLNYDRNAVKLSGVDPDYKMSLSSDEIENIIKKHRDEPGMERGAQLVLDRPDRSMSCRAALMLVLDPLGLDFRVEGDTIRVCTWLEFQRLKQTAALPDPSVPLSVVIIAMKERPIMVGEPSWMTIKFLSVSDKNVVLRLNGDYRNRLSNPLDEPAESLIVEVVDERGQKVAQPVAEAAMSGVITSDHPIRARGDATIDLFLPHWVTITEPGRYRVTIRCRGKLFPDTGKEYYLEKPDTRELTAETTLTVIPANAEKFGEFIEHWGPKLVGGKTQETHAEAERAHRMLEVLRDERVVPWYVKLLDQPRYDSKFSACDGLAPYGSDAAFAALKRAMATTGADVHETAEGKLAEGSADGIRHTAAIALSKNPHPEAAAFLLEQAGDRYSAVRITVLQFAARNKSPQARKVIDRMTRDKDESVAEEAKRLHALLAEEDAKSTSAEKAAIDRAIRFLKSRQREDGTWEDYGSMTGGTTALATVALLQAGVNPDDDGIQRALHSLAGVESDFVYVVSLQTMALCAATPKQDAELIRRNVAWIEQAQLTKGDLAGAWSYSSGQNASRGDHSNSRFAVMALDAAKRAGFEVQQETWQRVATHWLKTQHADGGWSYIDNAGPPTYSMTLAGVAGLATAHRYLPKDDQSAAREAALRKPHEFIAKTILKVENPWLFNSFQCLERAGHLTDSARFGDVDWKSAVTKQLIDYQRRDGAWKGPNDAESDDIATSFALMFLSGQPEERDGRKTGGNVNETAPPEKSRDDSDEKVAPFEGVIETVADKAISFDDGKVITTDAATKYARLTDKGEVPAERKELNEGLRVRYEVAPGKGATKVVILPAKKEGDVKTSSESPIRKGSDINIDAYRPRSRTPSTLTPEQVLARLRVEEGRYPHIEFTAETQQRPWFIARFRDPDVSDEDRGSIRFARLNDRSFLDETRIVKRSDQKFDSRFHHQETVQGRWWHRLRVYTPPDGKLHRDQELLVLPESRHPLGPHRLFQQGQANEAFSDSLTAWKQPIEVLGEELVGQDRCVAIRVRSDQFERRVWLALEKNMLPMRDEFLRLSDGLSSVESLTVVTATREISKGRWFPMELFSLESTRSLTDLPPLADRDLKVRQRLAVQTVAVDQPIDESLFDKLGKPPNTEPPPPGTPLRQGAVPSASVDPAGLNVPSPDKDNAVVPAPPNREQIGEVLGKPVYRDEVKDETLHGSFLGPVWKKYREAHRAAITPTDAELKFAADFFDKEHRQRIEAEGGEAKLREQIGAIEKRLAGSDLTGAEEKKIKLDLVVLQEKLKLPSSYGFAGFILDNWKFQKHLYDEFGGGRILWQQAGMEAFDATRTCLESLEKQGEFKITDAKLRAKLFEYWTRKNHPGLFTDKDVIRREFLEPKWIAPAVAKAPLRAVQDSAVVASGIVRGTVKIEGEVPVVPPLKLRPSFHGIIPRNEEERLRNQQEWEAAPVVEIPDESLVVSKEGAIANVAIYLKKAPKNWKSSDPPKDPVELRVEENHFHSRVSLIRVGQPLRLMNRRKDAVNFHSFSVRSNPFNLVVPPNSKSDLAKPFLEAESLPISVVSDIQSWMKTWLIALNHPFAAITDVDGRFEIRDLPPGEHHFTVWHERCGYLNKDLVVRVEDDKVAEVNLKYTAEQLERSYSVTSRTPPSIEPAVPEHPNPAVANLIRKFDEHIANQNFAEAEQAAKQAIELDPENPKLQRAKLIAAFARRLAADKAQPKRSSRMTIAYIERMMDSPERLKGNDREAAAKLVGRWKLTLPAGFVFAVEIKQTDDGCLSFDGPQKGVLYGKFAARGDRLELVDPNDKEVDDYVWRGDSPNKLSLVVSKTNNGADYTGAKLERMAASSTKDPD